MGSEIRKHQNISSIEEEIIQEFNLFDDWMSKYEYIIEMGKELPLMDDRYKDETNLIKGCQSMVWLFSEFKDGKVFYYGDGDMVIVKGIIAILIRVYSGVAPLAITTSDFTLLSKIGLDDQLSPSRSNGINSIISRMKSDAYNFISSEDLDLLTV
jgi:cysteine desulfuration protein SufE